MALVLPVVVNFLENVVKYAKHSPRNRLLVDIIGIGLTVIIALGIYRAAGTQSRAAFQGKQAHDYLCYQKQVVIPDRIQESLEYETNVQLHLRKPIPGITEADIQRGVERDQASLRALGRVKCKHLGG
jgi:hypothetical protein